MGSVREDRPPQDGLPRPAHPHRAAGLARGDPAQPRGRPSISRRSRSTIPRSTLCSAAATRWGSSSSSRSGMTEYLRKLHPKSLEDLIAMNALYRPGPLGSGMIDDFIERKQGREEDPVRAPAPRADPEGDLRGHRLPGAGDADRLRPGRLLAGRGRPAPPRDGEEEGRDHGRAARGLRRARPGPRRPPRWPKDLRPHGALRRLRLQQVPLRRLRPRRLPDRLPEGALPGRVHGRLADLGDVELRPGHDPARRCAPAGDAGASARREPLRRRVHRAGGGDPLRSRRGQGGRARRGRVDHRGPRRGTVPRSARSLRPDRSGRA